MAAVLCNGLLDLANDLMTAGAVPRRRDIELVLQQRGWSDGDLNFLFERSPLAKVDLTELLLAGFYHGNWAWVAELLRRGADPNVRCMPTTPGRSS